jgi:hypothetical protein
VRARVSEDIQGSTLEGPERARVIQEHLCLVFHRTSSVSGTSKSPHSLLTALFLLLRACAQLLHQLAARLCALLAVQLQAC